MANFLRFQMYKGSPVTISGDDPCIPDDLNETTVRSITVAGDAWVVFDSLNYRGDFRIFRVGNQAFPSTLTSIQSVRMINGGIDNSEITFYPHPFFRGTGEIFQSKAPQLQEKYFSLKVTKGAVVFFDGENYAGEKRILLNGDEVQNFTAVKLPSIGKSVKTARDMES
ncbi:unnamed protein product [Caretta caretta]